MLDHLVLDEAPVYVGVEMACRTPAALGRRHQTGHPHPPRILPGKRIERGGDRTAEHGRHPFLQVRVECPEYELAVVQVGKAHFGPGDGKARQQFTHVPPLGLLALHELEPGRGVEKEVPDGDHRAGGHAAPFYLLDPPPFDVNLRPFHRVGCPGGDGEPGNRGDRRQRLASKAERREGEEILVTGDLAGSVTLQRQEGVLAGHAASGVGHLDEPPPPRLDLDQHLFGARIEGVLHQFLGHGGGTFHHLARGNLVGQVFREYPNPCRQYEPHEIHNKRASQDTLSVGPL